MIVRRSVGSDPIQGRCNSVSGCLVRYTTVVHPARCVAGPRADGDARHERVSEDAGSVRRTLGWLAP